MYERRRLPQINISAIPVAGVGGLGLVAVVGIVAVAIIEVRIFLMAAFVVGCLMALALILARRDSGAGTWSGPSAHVFFENQRLVPLALAERRPGTTPKLRLATLPF
jgi:hypothetical protein